ncbi:hypothetical protein [Micromonospora sp. NPDC005806]|uniref:hypothetical protein n=1 Tax=Micromonospora sp. NPDC005806 TaxID=3364234 RepID=UPI003684DC50
MFWPYGRVLPLRSVTLSGSANALELAVTEAATVGRNYVVALCAAAPPSISEPFRAT